MRRGLVIGAALAAFVLDQLSKYVVVHLMQVERGAIEMFPPYLTFRYGENRGINFGLFQGSDDTARWVLIGLSVVICLGVLLWLRKSPGTWLTQFSAGLLIGGALGNVFDRLVYGYVLDFLNMSCCGINNPFVFNVADVFIFAGAFGVILFEGKGKPAKNAP